MLRQLQSLSCSLPDHRELWRCMQMCWGPGSSARTMRCYHDTASYPVTHVRPHSSSSPRASLDGWYHRSGHESRAGASPITIWPRAMWYADGPYTWPELRCAAFLNRFENIYWMWAHFMRGAYYITTQWLLSARVPQKLPLFLVY